MSLKQFHMYIPSFSNNSFLLCQDVLSNFQLKRYNQVIGDEDVKHKAFGSLGSDQLLIALTEYELGEGTLKIKVFLPKYNIC